MSATAAVQLEQRANSATLIIDNPSQKNALTPAILEDLRAQLKALEAEGRTRALVLRGAGDVFSSGFAIDRFPDPDQLPKEDAIELLSKQIEHAPFVVVAQIEGLCVGAALDVACACDLRFSTQDARLGITPAKLGLIYSWQGMNRVQRTGGRDVARQLLFSAELVRADSQIGRQLVSGLAEDGTTLDKLVAGLIAAIAANAPLSIAGTKRALRALDEASALDDDLSEELHGARRAAMASEDCAEGRAAFSQRRTPSFTGR